MISVREADEAELEEAMRRWILLRPCVEEAVPARAAARAAGVSVRTMQRWLKRYRAGGVGALSRSARRDRGARRVGSELVDLVEDLARFDPPLTVTAIHRQVVDAATLSGLPTPSYSTVYDIVRDTLRHSLASGSTPPD